MCRPGNETGHQCGGRHILLAAGLWPIISSELTLTRVGIAAQARLRRHPRRRPAPMTLLSLIFLSPVKRLACNDTCSPYSLL